ncbi:tetraspanin-7-like isoform X2 [Pectinophora gossypiella]|uniref:tetraspanin-7-like isoform X2 n=1 Tax=Pectinophora gossypiella TaxID=13191 RepID=UPI00214E94A6|nr:tetraspanin-7-like isoform X2 [Pectinophora gossypiella]
MCQSGETKMKITYRYSKVTGVMWEKCEILLALTGLFLLTVGLWAEFDLYKYMELSPEFSGTAPHVIIGIAGLIILISSIAFSCIIKGQPVLLYIYGGFLACIFMMDAGVGASVACYRDTFAKGLHDGLTNTLTSYNPQKANFDFAQSTLHCCGVSNYTDWMRLSPQRVIPISCCLDPNRCVTANYNDVYQRGCYEVILEYLNNNMDLLIGIAVGTALLPLVGTVLSCCLASYIKKSKYDVMN